MLRRSFFTLAATAALFSACSGDIEDSLSGGRQNRPGDLGDGVGFVDPPAPFPQDDPSCPSAAAVVSASDGWQSVDASQPAFGSLEFEVMARPEAANIDALVAVGAQDIADFSDGAIKVRFADDGLIDVRDGSGYDRDVAVAYEPGVWYTIFISVDISTRTYDVEVGPCGKPRQELITGAAFESEASESDRLTTWAAWSSQSAKLDVAIPAWVTSGSCAPATCESLGLECGAPGDGCGGNLSCGGCGSGQACASGGVCLDVSTPPPPPPPGEDPSEPADSCPMSTPLSSACVCGGSAYSAGFCCEEGFSFSPCTTKARYVRPGGGGARDGSDWANALNGLPSELERDTVYWLGAGSYGSYTFDDAASGQLGITLRKATAQTYGSSIGWNAGYGSGQAVFGPLRFDGSRYTLDGGEPNGFRTVGQMGTEAAVQVDGSQIVLRHVEINGGLQKSNGKQTAGGCNGSNIYGDYVVFDRCEVHNIADDGLGIYSSDHVKVLRSKIHDLDGCGTDGGCGPCYNGHSDGLELSDISDIELIGNMVYDVRSNAAIFMDNWSDTKIRNLVAYNNVFYTPDTGFAVYLHRLDGAEFHNNVIWGKTQGSRYGGLAMGQDITGLEMTNNIILNINYSHMGASHDPIQHRLDYNLFGMIDAGEYPANSHDLVGDPQFAGIPMSSDAGEHKGSNLTLEDFRSSASQVIDTGIIPAGIPAYDIVGEARPQGDAWDRGPFEALR